MAVWLAYRPKLLFSPEVYGRLEPLHNKGSYGVSGRDDQNVGSQDDARRGQFNPMKLPSAGGRPSGPRGGDDAASPDGRGKDRVTPPPPSGGPPRFGGPGNQFRPLPRYGEAGADASVPPPGRDQPPREHFEARHAPRDDSYPGYTDASFEIPAERGRGSAQRDDRDWDESAAPRGRSGRDPWDRDWASWSVARAGYSEELDAFARSDGEWEHWNRSSWGRGPDEGTMASVAVMVAPEGFSRKTKAAGKQKPMAELVLWAKAGFARSAKPSKAAVRLLVVLSILGTLFLSGAGVALSAYSDYAYLKGLASSGQAALLHVGQDLGLGSKSTKGQKVDPAHASMAQGDINLAISDFEAIHEKLQHPDFLLAVGGNVPKVQQLLQSGLILSSVATDGAKLANSLFPALIVMANIVNASPISTTTSSTDSGDIVSASDFLQIKDAIPAATPFINHMAALIQSTPPDTLMAALNAKQQGELKPLLQLVPQIQPALGTLSDFLNVAPKLLGIGTGYPVSYLLMTLDRSEIRPVGGFQGQYAIFGAQGGRIGHISLTDVYKTLEPFQNLVGTYNRPLDYPNLSLPAENSWFPNTQLGWAMRNSGLSPDFNQDARNALWYLHNETTCIPLAKLTRPVCFPGYDQAIIPGGDHLPIVDASGKIVGYDPARAHMGGVIMIQTSILSQLLGVIGPIHIGCPYNVDVNAQNLETLIHTYQETDAGRKIGNNPCGTQLSDATKRFTATIAQTLQDKVKTVPKGELLTFAGDLLQDLHTGDIRIYLSDPDAGFVNNGPYAFNTPNKLYPENKQAMALLRQYHIASDMYGTVDAKGNPVYFDTNGKFDDSLAINRADVAGWKLEDYVSVKIVDQIKLDKHGNATHNMEMDYIFTIPKIQPANQPYTYDGLVQALFNTVYNAANKLFYDEHIRVYVNPNATNYESSTGLYATNSDVPDRAEFAAGFNYVATPTPDDSTVTWAVTSAGDGTPSEKLNWVVPHVVTNGVYTFHLERQSGVTTSYDITVTSVCASTPLIQQQGSLTVNLLLTAKVPTC